MSVDEIEKEIPKLSFDERARLLKLLSEMDEAEWDRQIVEDAKNGKLDKLAQQALDDVKVGRFREL